MPHRRRGSAKAQPGKEPTPQLLFHGGEPGSSNGNEGAAPKPKVRHSSHGSILSKTKMCRFYNIGLCKRGSRCSFAHRTEDLVPMPDFFCTKRCQNVIATGICEDADCRFAHDDSKIRQNNWSRSDGGGETGFNNAEAESSSTSTNAEAEGETVPKSTVPIQQAIGTQQAAALQPAAIQQAAGSQQASNRAGLKQAVGTQQDAALQQAVAIEKTATLEQAAGTQQRQPYLAPELPSRQAREAQKKDVFLPVHASELWRLSTDHGLHLCVKGTFLNFAGLDDFVQEPWRKYSSAPP